MEILAIIPARGVSKGIPKKNIVPLLGKPLIAWTIEASKASKYINRTIVSSDSDEILKVSEEYGAEAVKRPDDISGDNAPFQLLITHALETLKNQENYFPDFLAYLQPTSPLRTTTDIDKAMEYMLSKKAEALISVYPQDKKFLKTFIVNSKGYLEGAVNDIYPFANRQDLPDLFMPNGAIFIIKTSVFLKRKQLFAPKTVPFVMDADRSVDVDNLEDLLKIEKILKSAS